MSRLATCRSLVVLALFGAPAVPAWGPATHTAHARLLLRLDDSSGLLGAKAPDDPLMLIRRQPKAFGFGCIFPDVRELTPRRHPLRRLTHRYDFVFTLRERARTEPETAFALGNLAHLAQDTGAQLFYVPHKMCAGRIGVYRVLGASQEDYIEGMVELYHGDFTRLWRDAGKPAPELLQFYANAVAEYTDDTVAAPAVMRLGRKFCRVARCGVVIHPSGYVINATLLPLLIPFSSLPNPFFYRDADEYFKLGNEIFCDLARNGRDSLWHRNWPVSSGKVMLFAGTQGEPLVKRARCRNGILIYDAAFHGPNGRRLCECPVGAGTASLRLLLSCTRDVTAATTVTVRFRPRDGGTHSVLARAGTTVDMRVLDPGHRRRIDVDFVVPTTQGTVYFTADLAPDRSNRDEFSSLRPRCRAARKHKWPPVLEVTQRPDDTPETRP